MYLDEFAVGVIRALLIQRRLRRPSADHGIGGLAENGAVSAGGDDDRLGGEGDDFHAAQVHGADAAANAVLIHHAGEEFPTLVLGDLALGLVAAHLFIERIKKLLPGGRAGKGGTVVERPAEAAEVEHAFGSAIEGHAHAVEQVDNAGRHVAHDFYGRLVGEEVAAIYRVVEVLPGGVALALEVLGGVDAALGADRVRPLDRDDGEEVNVTSHLGDFNGGGKSRQPTTYNDDLRICHDALYETNTWQPQPPELS